MSEIRYSDWDISSESPPNADMESIQAEEDMERMWERLEAIESSDKAILERRREMENMSPLELVKIVETTKEEREVVKEFLKNVLPATQDYRFSQQSGGGGYVSGDNTRKFLELFVLGKAEPLNLEQLKQKTEHFKRTTDMGDEDARKLAEGYLRYYGCNGYLHQEPGIAYRVMNISWEQQSKIRQAVLRCLLEASVNRGAKGAMKYEDQPPVSENVETAELHDWERAYVEDSRTVMEYNAAVASLLQQGFFDFTLDSSQPFLYMADVSTTSKNIYADPRPFRVGVEDGSSPRWVWELAHITSEVDRPRRLYRGPSGE